MLGYDAQLGSLIVGVVGEVGRGKAEDSVSAFSTTPAAPWHVDSALMERRC